LYNDRIFTEFGFVRINFALRVGSFRNFRVTIEAAAQPVPRAGGFVL